MTDEITDVQASPGEWQNEPSPTLVGKPGKAHCAVLAAGLPPHGCEVMYESASAVSLLHWDDAAAFTTAQSLNVSGGKEPH